MAHFVQCSSLKHLGVTLLWHFGLWEVSVEQDFYIWTALTNGEGDDASLSEI